MTLDTRPLRQSLDLTQQELASMLGVHTMTISKWEQGKAEPAPYHVQQISLLHLGLPVLSRDERLVVKRLLAMGSGVGALSLVVMRGIASQGDDAAIVGEA